MNMLFLHCIVFGQLKFYFMPCNRIFSFSLRMDFVCPVSSAFSSLFLLVGNQNRIPGVQTPPVPTATLFLANCLMLKAIAMRWRFWIEFKPYMYFSVFLSCISSDTKNFISSKQFVFWLFILEILCKKNFRPQFSVPLSLVWVIGGQGPWKSRQTRCMSTVVLLLGNRLMHTTNTTRFPFWT